MKKKKTSISEQYMGVLRDNCGGCKTLEAERKIGNTLKQRIERLESALAKWQNMAEEWITLYDPHRFEKEDPTMSVAMLDKVIRRLSESGLAILEENE